MNIDFHHGTTYVIARIAGFDHKEAEVIAYCAQYIDDATNDGFLHFDNGAMYQRCATAHKSLDYRSMGTLAKGTVWIPFHFVPGNGGLGAGKDPSASFIDKLVTRPNSHVARDMVKAAHRESKRKPYRLHWLGIISHVFCDTWAHQGFCGVTDKVNAVSHVEGDGRKEYKLLPKTREAFWDMVHRQMPPLGHGAALSYPDRPFMVWSYTNGRGERVERDNPTDFLLAADELCRVFRRWRLKDMKAEVTGLPEDTLQKFSHMFRSLKSPDENARHRSWLDAIANDDFGIGPVDLTYYPKGKGSWKYQALGTERERDQKGEVFHYSDAFMKSDYKMFHDAAKAHRRMMVDDILPKYGICVA